MNPEPATCPNCGKPVSPNSLMALCPDCLLRAGFATGTETEGTVAFPPPTPEELAPLFPQLEIISVLGRGGMGVVYQVRQKSLNRLVALKLLAPERVGDAGFAARFQKALIEKQLLPALEKNLSATAEGASPENGEFIDYTGRVWSLNDVANI